MSTHDQEQSERLLPPDTSAPAVEQPPPLYPAPQQNVPPTAPQVFYQPGPGGQPRIVYSAQPTAMVGQPAAMVGQPAAMVGQPTAMVGQPATMVGQPAAMVGQPTAMSGQPTAMSGQPTAMSGQPTAMVGQPTPMFTPQPTAMVTQPYVAPMQPLVTAPLGATIPSQYPPPNSFLILSVITLIICGFLNLTSIIFGIPALLFSLQSEDCKRQLQYSSAKSKGNIALVLTLIDIVYTAVTICLVIGLSVGCGGYRYYNCH